MNKRGQGLSLTTIIVAALALIVLVVLVMIFTGRIAIFQKGVSEQGQAELTAMRVLYGGCHPTAGAENEFTSGAQSDSQFRALINRCKALDEANCAGDCAWG